MIRKRRADLGTLGGDGQHSGRTSSIPCPTNRRNIIFNCWPSNGSSMGRFIPPPHWTGISLTASGNPSPQAWGINWELGVLSYGRHFPSLQGLRVPFSAERNWGRWAELTGETWLQTAARSKRPLYSHGPKTLLCLETEAARRPLGLLITLLFDKSSSIQGLHIHALCQHQQGAGSPPGADNPSQLK